MRDIGLTLHCVDFDETLAFLTDRLGFRLDVIFPADAPHSAVLSRSGQALHLHAPRRVGRRQGHSAGWTTGRAGMQYRDLISGRLGGRLVASHIRIPHGGPVPDYVHWHDVRLQMIFCYKGWVRVVYENQGLPFLMHAGDCVLQPPRLRHRVLECSDGFEAVEISTPAEHETHVDHDMQLPNVDEAVGSRNTNQRFVFFRAAGGNWQPGPADGLEFMDGGMEEATRGAASLRLVRARTPSVTAAMPPDAGLQFGFVLQGAARLRRAGEVIGIRTADAFTVAADDASVLESMSADFRFLHLAFSGLP